MGYSSSVPSYDVDLSTPPSQRWKEVIECEGDAMRSLGIEAAADLMQASSLLMSPLLHKVFNLGYRCFGGPYQQEMRYIAEGLGLPPATAVMFNCTYELSHLGGGSTPFGCTAGVKWVPGVGNVHVRNMDWPLLSIGKATCLLNYKDDDFDHNFVSVGIAGMVGVLSGMVPGAYSVTINWAPPVKRPTWDWGALFLLRQVLHTCATYEEAIEALSTTVLSTSVFFTVCGTKRGQACVIERTQDHYGIREMGKSLVLTQSNHHVLEEFEENNASLYEEEEGYETVIKDSSARAKKLEQAMRRANSYDSVVACLDREPVRNEYSYQQMAFVPAAGKVDAWRWI